MYKLVHLARIGIGLCVLLYVKWRQYKTVHYMATSIQLHRDYREISDIRLLYWADNIVLASLYFALIVIMFLVARYLRKVGVRGEGHCREGLVFSLWLLRGEYWR